MPDSILEGTTQGSSQQSLVEIGSVVSEENIFFLISSPLFSISSLAAILVESRDHRTQLWKGGMQRPFHQSLVAIGPVVSEENILCEFQIGSFVKLSSTVAPSWSKCRTDGHIFGREPSNDYFIKI
jgi:hypothetical protein